MRAASLVGIAAELLVGLASTSIAMTIYIGTYTGKGSEGIYRVELDETGKMSPPVLAATTTNPTFLAINASGRMLYSANDVGEFEGRKSGAVVAFRVGSDGSLALVGQQATGAQGPCFISIDPSGRLALFAHYGAGVVSSVALDGDGLPTGIPTAIRTDGDLGPRKDRQDAPHAHSVYPTPDGRRAISADLGTDRLNRFDIDKEAGTIRKTGFVATPAGDGPRHLAFSNDGRILFVANELANTLSLYDFDSAADTITWRSATSTLPRAATNADTVSEVAVHPSGRFVYVANRGHDSIAVFAFDASERSVRLIGTEPTQGKHPRHFAVSPDGKWLVVANQQGNNVVSYAIDERTGQLSATGSVLTLDRPMCIRFLPI